MLWCVLLTSLSPFTSQAFHIDTYPNHGAVTLKLTASAQDLDYEQTSLKTNTTSLSTNITQNFKSTVTNTTLDAADLLALLKNSLNTTFPADAKLQLTRSANVLSFFISDSTGTNVILGNNTNLVFNLQPGEAPLHAGKETLIQTYKSSGNSSGGNDTESITAFVTLGYDDTGLATQDGTHTKFEISCIVTSKSSYDLGTHKVKETIKLQGVGFGSFHDKDHVFEATGSTTLSGTLPILF
jgi:hypothetical protein